MELWIRSQDKAILQKVNKLYVCKYAEEKGYGIYDLLYNDLDDCDVPLGFYKTRERALEVLDEIQKSLLPRGIIKTRMILNQEDIKRIRNIYEGQFDVVDNRIKEIQMSSTCYYEMPED